MTKHPACGNTPALPEAPYSMSDPYREALYLHSLCQAASFIVDDFQMTKRQLQSGLPGLLTVIEERSAALADTLDPLYAEAASEAQHDR